jgi:hypothetical protein
MFRFCKKTITVGIVLLGLIGGLNVGLTVGASANASTTAAVKINISEDEAINIALKAYQGAELISIKLYETAYTVRIATPMGKRYLKIGALSGRILENYPIDPSGKIIRNLSSTPEL